MHGKTYRFTDGEERKPETLGGQMLGQKEVNYPIQLYLPLQEKSLLQLTATQAKKRLEEGRKL